MRGGNACVCCFFCGFREKVGNGMVLIYDKEMPLNTAVAVQWLTTAAVFG